MAPRRRQATSNSLAIWIGTASVVAGGLAWAYYAMRDGSSTTASGRAATPARENNNASSRATPGTSSRAPTGKGKRPVLTLVLRAGQYPPKDVLTRLVSAYTLRLVVPYRADSDKADDGTSHLEDASEAATALGVIVIPHETAEGVVHVCRALSGLVVIVTGPEQGRDQSRMTSPSFAPLPLDRIVRDIRTFVRGLIVCRLEAESGSDKSTTDDVLSADMTRAVTVVAQGGWQALLDKLDA